MSLKSSFWSASLVVAALALPVAAYSQATGTPPPSQAPAKPEAKSEAAPSLAGKWNMNVESPNGAMQTALDIVVDAKEPKKITGNPSSQMGDAPLEGEIGEEGKVTFWITMNAGGNNMSITFVGKVQKDGSLAGTLDFGQGEIPWTAVRVKN
jgi:hypothetical protein